jgi:hypothetical protein
MNIKKLTNYSIASILGIQNENNNLDQLNTNQSTKNRARRARTNFNNEAVCYLEEIFKTNQYPDINEREKLARKIDTTEARIQVWFQNKRSRNRKQRGVNINNNNNTKIDGSSSNDSYNSNDSASELLAVEQQNVQKISRIPFNNHVNNLNCYQDMVYYNQICFKSC